MFIPSISFKPGDTVQNIRSITTVAGTFTEGHLFTVIGHSSDPHKPGLHIRDKDGNEILDANPAILIKIFGH